ncbi:MAG: PilT/PilU family type 4a pilus ATPase [Polyangiaceae bacterium]|nr:PilT/PilU family type 4a pilus ATPase [Polyangiaceae bacterium]
MPQLDSLLRIVDAQGADELRLGSDKNPSMFSASTPKRLTIPPTSTATLLELFGELLDDSRRALLERHGRVELVHEAQKLGPWTVIVTKRPGADLTIDAVVRRGSKAPAAPEPQPQAPAAPPPDVKADRTAPQADAPATPLAPQPNALPPLDATPGPAVLAAALAELVTRAVALGATDLHLADREPPTVRIHGRLQSLGAALAEPLASLLDSVLSPSARQRLHTRASCDLGIDLPGGGRARVNVFRTSRGLAAAIRFLPRVPRAVEELGFPVAIDDLAMLSNGLVLTTGVTGSGKSTTLAALASAALQRRSIVLVSLEDPIEYVFEPGPSSLVRQRQIGREVPDFQSGLRDALREDPDVILVGEMRDPESIALALTAAETGHLVLASLHSRSAATAVDRIVDAMPGERQTQIRIQLADALRAVVAQRLLPREDGGRVLVVEVLRASAAVSNAIREGKTSTLRSAMQSGKSAGMIPLERCLADLVRRRAISMETARHAADDPAALQQYLTEKSSL